VVFGRLEDIDGDAIRVALFICSVEEIEEELEWSAFRSLGMGE